MQSRWDATRQIGSNWKRVEKAPLFQAYPEGVGECFAGVEPTSRQSCEREARKAVGVMKPVAGARLSFIYFDAGGGHRSAAKALVAAAQEKAFAFARL